MADRDALIAICWFAIVLMIFFECFYRRMKRRFQRDVQPNQRNEAGESLLESGSQVAGNQEETRNNCSRHSATSFFRTGRFSDAAPNYNQVIARSSNYPPLPPCMLPRQQQIERLRAMEGVEGSNSLSTTIPMDLIEEEENEEEPPPTYEEAMTFARLTRKFRLAPYGFYLDTETRQLSPPQITNPPDVVFEVEDENEATHFLGHSSSSSESYIESESDSVFEDDADEEDNEDEDGDATEYENDHLHDNSSNTKDWNNNANGSQTDLARIDCGINSTRNSEVPGKDPAIFENDKKVEVAVGVSAEVELEQPQTII